MDIGFKLESIKYLMGSRPLTSFMSNLYKVIDTVTSYKVRYKILTDYTDNFFTNLDKESKVLFKLLTKIEKYEGFFIFETLNNKESFFDIKENVLDNIYLPEKIVKLTNILYINMNNGKYKESLKYFNNELNELKKSVELVKRYKDLLLDDTSIIKVKKVKHQINKNDLLSFNKLYKDFKNSKKNLLLLLVKTKDSARAMEEEDTNISEKYLVLLMDYFKEYFKLLIEYRNLIISIYSLVEFIDENDAKDIETDRTIII